MIKPPRDLDARLAVEHCVIPITRYSSRYYTYNYYVKLQVYTIVIIACTAQVLLLLRWAKHRGSRSRNKIRMSDNNERDRSRYLMR